VLAQDLMADTVREPMVVLDTDLRVLSANRAFYEAFKVAGVETEKRLIYELGGHQWNIPASDNCSKMSSRRTPSYRIT